jgi:hypothetical protein
MKDCNLIDRKIDREKGREGKTKRDKEWRERERKEK